MKTALVVLAATLASPVVLVGQELHRPIVPRVLSTSIAAVLDTAAVTGAVHVPLTSVASSASPPASAAGSEPWIGWPILGGLALGTAGWFAGALLALEIEEDCGEDFCFFDEVIFLGAATGTTGLALGVHLGNGRRGNFALDLLTAGAVWATGFVLFVASDNSDLAVPLAFIVPIGQLAATTAVERAKGRAKARRRAEVFVAPRRDGRVALGASISF
jgi:hypothetical protein